MTQRLSAWALLSMTLLSFAGRAEGQYIFTSIDYPGAEATFSNGVTPAGDVVGEYDLGGATHAFIRSAAGTYTTFSHPNAVGYTSANGMNSAGQIVGSYSPDGSTLRAYLRTGDAYMDLVPAPGAPLTFGTYINESGHAVGFSEDGIGIRRGFIFDGTNYTPVVEPTATVTELFGINAAGTVVGDYISGGVIRGFSYNGSFTTLNYPNATTTVAQGINDSGQIAGLFTAGGVDHGFLKDDAKYKSFDYPGATLTWGFAINNAGQIVGYYEDASLVGHGFLATPKPNTVSFQATDNATVLPAGPRTGASGKNFFNVEGSNNGAFASFGVADFNLASLPSLGGTVTAVSGVTLKLTQTNAAFSHDGPVSVYLTDQTGIDIQPTNTNLNFVATMSGAASVDADLAPLTLLGSGAYVNAGTALHPVDSYALTFEGAALTSLLTAINDGTTLRLVVAPDASDAAATYAGFSHSTLPGPTLEFEYSLDEATLEADFDVDGAVDGDDLAAWSANVGAGPGAFKSDGDADADGDVDGADLLVWQRQFKPASSASPASSGVPEPASLVLAAGAASIGLRKTRRPRIRNSL